MLDRDALIRWLRTAEPRREADGLTPRLYRAPSGIAQPLSLLDGLDADQVRYVRRRLEAAGYVAEALSTHEAARDLLAGCLEGGRPFVLFLRSFGLEAKAHSTYQFAADLDKQDLHGDVLRLLPEGIPIVGVRNWHDRGRAAAIPSIEIPDDAWLPVVAALIRFSAMIVVRLQTRSAGVAQELAAIIDLGRQPDTVVVISEPDPGVAEAMRIVALVSAGVEGLPAPEYDPPLRPKDVGLLRAHGFFVMHERDPASPGVREKIRAILQGPAGSDPSPDAPG